MPLVALLTALLMAIGATSVAAQSGELSGDPVLERRITSQIDIDLALDHLHHFTEVIGPRLGGTPAENAAAQYLATELESYGYDVELQGFPASNKNVGTIVLPGRPALQGGIALNGARTNGDFLSGAVVFAGTGLSPDDFPGGTAGKIVLMTDANSNANRLIQVTNAANAGALGAILRRTQATPFDPNLTSFQPIPVIGVGNGQGGIVMEFAGTGAVISMDTAQLTGLTSYNVLASRPPTVGDAEDAPIVMVSNHYDSVRGAPGANDDGSGAMLTLELARVLKDLKTDKELRFSFWGAEEQGLVGSNYYVNNAPQALLDRFVGLWQNDMVATSWGPADRYNLLAVDGQHNLVTQSVAAVAPRLGYQDLILGPIVRGGSDHVPFHNRGIPAANHSWRPISGPGNLEPPYHTPEDTIANNISPERWRISMELIGSAVYVNAQTAEDGFDLLTEVVDDVDPTSQQWRLVRFLDRIEREMADGDTADACLATAAYADEVERLTNVRPEHGRLDDGDAYELAAVTDNLYTNLGC